MTPCRCGHTGDGPHPCHGGGYTCRQPAQPRLYRPLPVAIAGQRLNLAAVETWACDECWALRLAGTPRKDAP